MRDEDYELTLVEEDYELTLVESDDDDEWINCDEKEDDDYPTVPELCEQALNSF